MTAIRCSDVMTPAVYCLDPDESIDRAAGKLLRQKISGCPVVEDDKVIGVISEVDLLRALYPVTQGETPTGKVRDHMTPTPIGLKPDADVLEAAHFFFEYPVRRAPVMDENGALQGLVSRRDVLRALEELARQRRIQDE